MRKAWNNVLSKTNIKVPFEKYFSRIGRPFKDIMIDLGIDDDLGRVERMYMEASFDFLDEAKFFSGAIDSLKTLQNSGLKLGIVTSKDQSRTHAVLKQIDISFVTIQTPCKLYRGKPAPDYLLIAMAEAGEDPLNTLYIGDMNTDHEAAMRAGIDYVHASWGYGQPIDSAKTIANISELPGYIL